MGQAAAEAKRVVKVVVEGNRTVSEGVILNKANLRPGAVFSEQTVAEAVRRVAAMPQMADVQWRAEVQGQEVIVVFVVRETDMIEAVEFSGNKSLKEKDLLAKLGFGAGDHLDRYLVTRGATNLEELYREKGFYFARVRLDEAKLRDERRVVYVIVEGPKLRVKKVRFVGNQSLSAGKLQGKIKTKAYFPIFSRGQLVDEQLDQDQATLQGFYRDEGFLDARVFWEKQFNEKKTRATVTFTVEEGPRYRVAGVRFQGVEKLAEAELRAALDPDLTPGKVLTYKRRVFAERAVERTYGKHGYIYTIVRLEPEYAEQEGQVTAVFRVQESGQFHLGRLLVQGNTETQDKVVRRAFDHFGFLPGGLYDTAAMEKGKERLLGGGLFEDVSVLPVGPAPDERDALVEVKETRTGLLLFGVGVDTNSGVMGEVSIQQQNYDASRWPRSFSDVFAGEAWKGAGQRLQFTFSPGTQVTTGHVKFFEPYLFDQPYYLDATLMLFRRWRESYLEERKGGSVTLGRRFANDWSVEVGLRGEEVTVSELDYKIVKDTSVQPPLKHKVILAPPQVQEVEGDNFLTSMRFGVGLDKTDNLYRPSDGYRLNADYEQYGALGGDFAFGALGAGVTMYRTVYQDITERKTVWAAAVRGSQIAGDAPVFEKYYAGGIGSLRGFDYRGVSPRSGPRDDPVGSESLLLVNTELTHPIFEEVIFGKVFCDSGVVTEGRYRVTVGFGLELLVPQLFQMVPMHFDFGFPVVWDDKDDKQVFSFSFGLSF